jgi:hypothetical protein
MSLFATTTRRPHRGSLPAPFLRSTRPPSPSGVSARSRSFHAETSALDVDAQLVLAQIQQLSINLSTARGAGDVYYVLTLRHARAGVEWTLLRSFDDFHAFQRRLRAALRPGHVCIAGGCPWLENVLVSYFPARNPLFFLRDSFPTLVRRRRDALLSAMRAIQGFLSSHTNHTCAIITQCVAPEFLRFVRGDDISEDGADPDSELDRTKMREALRVDAVRALVIDGRACSEPGFATPCLSTGSCRELSSRSSISTSTTTTSASSCDNSESSGASSANDKPLAASGICELCALPMPVTNVYVTQLRCGHRFHDECVLPKLNEALQCPLCGQRDDQEGDRRGAKSPLNGRTPRLRSPLRDMHSV